MNELRSAEKSLAALKERLDTYIVAHQPTCHIPVHPDDFYRLGRKEYKGLTLIPLGERWDPRAPSELERHRLVGCKQHEMAA